MLEAPHGLGAGALLPLSPVILGGAVLGNLIEVKHRRTRAKRTENASGKVAVRAGGSAFGDEVNLSVNAAKTGLRVDDIHHLTTLEVLTVHFETEGDPGVEVEGDVADLLCCVLIFHTISIKELRRKDKLGILFGFLLPVPWNLYILEE